ncbi:IMP dehydrogenase [Piscinibacter sp. XHJ-5]|uniref:guanosine monophosphate reductase n=1 Tax=Piscinibacter sp. XHJ-5 TaxID=3037797 RepID=UPI002452FCDE|nr:IMP dehydrogenase [Piscinibacter sp. XHJ-5]
MSVLDKLAEYLTFEDLSLLPGSNRGTPNGVCLTSPVTRRHALRVPLVSAGMPSITEAAMAISMGELGGLGVIHRYQSVEAQCAMTALVASHAPDRRIYGDASVLEGGRLLAAASVEPTDLERAIRLARAGAGILFLDTSNPVNDEVFDGARRIRAEVDADLVIGSVVDGHTVRRYAEIGIDGIKVGLGSGALCSIRQTTGVGAPQATALAECHESAAKAGVPLISDGGIRTSGDVVKALAIGASTAMLGSLLAGSDEAPGALVEIAGKPMKQVAGLRLGALEFDPPTGLPKVDAYLARHAAPRVEGGEGLIPASGPCHLTLLRLLRGIRAGIHMAGATSVDELRAKARLIRASAAGIAEAGVRL